MKTIQVKVKLGARVSNLVERSDGTWLAQVKSPPVDGKANEEVVLLVSRKFDLRKAQVTIRHGTSGRMKLIQIDD